MFDKADVFSDVFAQRRNLVTEIDPRTKIIFTFLALIINLISPGIYTPIIFMVLCLITLLVIRVPAKLLLLRLSIPLMMAAVIMITQVFLYGETPLFTLSSLGISVTGYVEGLHRGLLIVCRTLSGVSLILLLSMSTPADKLFTAATWFRIPKIFIEIALLIYRYIFVLTDELITMHDAQKIRLGYHSWKQSMKSVSTLGACLILRAYDRAERVFEAMLVRGYTGARINYIQVFSKTDSYIAVFLAMFLVIIYLAERFIS